MTAITPDSSDTFASLFGPIIASVRQVTGKPLLIAETGVGPDSGQEREAQIRGLFAGAESDNLLGVIWFDETQNDGPYHQDWRLEDNPGGSRGVQGSRKGVRVSVALVIVSFLASPPRSG